MPRFAIDGVPFDVTGVNLNGKQFMVVYGGNTHGSYTPYRNEDGSLDHDTGYVATDHLQTGDMNGFPIMTRVKVRIFWNDVGQFKRGDVIAARASFQRAPSGDLDLGETGWVLVGNVA